MTASLWPQLLSSALVGTQRRPCLLERVEGPLATVVPAGDLDAERLLSAAAAVTVLRRVATNLPRVTPPPPAPAETAGYVPTRAGARLGRLLADLGGLNYRHRLALVDEWLGLARVRDLLAPSRYLAELADLATREPDLGPAVLAVGGERLPWLAAMGPARWGWIVETPAGKEDWHTGQIEARARHLATLRAADPAAGRVLLEKVWTQERAADLAALIGACATGLSADDEAWLERALDDRRMQVREAAAALLATLPGSAYRARAAERALACCRSDAQGRIAITLPAEFDAGMRRDGLSLKPPQGMGEKAWWLLQIVATAPLACWSNVDLSSVEARDDWTGLLRQGWARAAVRQRDVSWALELTRLPSTQGSELHSLMSVLPAEVLAQRAIELVRDGDARMTEALAAMPAPWPSLLTEAVLAHLREGTVGRQGHWWALALAVERKLDPSSLPFVVELVPRSEGRLRDALDRLTETLAIRYDMHQEFL